MGRGWHSRAFQVLAGVFLAACALPHFGGAAPVDTAAPANSLGASDAHGFLQIWEELDEVDFGNGLKLPLRIQFSSGAPNGVSPFFGRGFWCPLTNAHCYLKRERMMRVTLLCGKAIYLEREKVDRSRFHSLDRQWLGVADEDTFVLSRADGWELKYVNGKFARLRTDTGRILHWLYAGEIVSEIREEGSGNSPFKVIIGEDGRPTGFRVNENIHRFELGKRPRIEKVNEQNLVAALEESLLAWNFPDGTRDLFQFEVNAALSPTLKFVGRDKQENVFGWDPFTQFVTFENGWKYRIEKSGKSDLPKLRRVNELGEEEYLYIDKRKGTTERKSKGSAPSITQAFTTEGPLYGKIRKVEQLDEGGRTVLYQAAYDEAGRLSRKIAGNKITSYSYSPEGKLLGKRTTRSDAESFVARMKQEEAKLLLTVSSALSALERQKQLQKLADFYIHTSFEPEKAISLLQSITDIGSRYSTHLYAINYNDQLASVGKVAGYRKLMDEYRDYLEGHPRQKRALLWLIDIRTNEDEI